MYVPDKKINDNFVNLFIDILTKNIYLTSTEIIE